MPHRHKERKAQREAKEAEDAAASKESLPEMSDLLFKGNRVEVKRRGRQVFRVWAGRFRPAHTFTCGPSTPVPVPRTRLPPPGSP